VASTRDPVKNRESRMRSYWRHHDRELERAKHYRETHRAQLRQRGRQRYHQRQLQEILRSQEQRCCDAAVATELTAEQWRFVLAYYGQRCAYSGESPNGEVLQLDHVVPLSAGGRHALGNVVPALASINVRKSAREPVAFLELLGLDVDAFLTRLEGCTTAWEREEDARRVAASGVEEYDIDEHYRDGGQGCPPHQQNTTARTG